MKTEDYFKIPYREIIIEDTEEGGYVAYFPDLKGCITCGETMEQTAANAVDAKKVWIEAALENGYDIPIPVDNARKIKHPE